MEEKVPVIRLLGVMKAAGSGALVVGAPNQCTPPGTIVVAERIGGSHAPIRQ